MKIRSSEYLPSNSPLLLKPSEIIDSYIDERKLDETNSEKKSKQKGNSLGIGQRQCLQGHLLRVNVLCLVATPTTFSSVGKP